MKQPGTPASPWDFSSFVPEGWYRWRLDGAEVFLKNSGKDWFWATRPKDPQDLHRDFGGPERIDHPPEVEVRRAISSSRSLALRPFTLTRPFLVSITRSVSVLPDEEVEFLVDLPVSVHWMTKEGEILAHPNTINLHKTWFGDTSSGRLCFLWSTTLEPPPLEPFGSMVRCRILIRNSAKATLVLKQFPLYWEYLNLWYGPGGMRSDLILVECLGDLTLRMTTEPYRGADTDSLLHPAAVGPKELLFQRGVDFLRSLAGIS